MNEEFRKIVLNRFRFYSAQTLRPEVQQLIAKGELHFLDDMFSGMTISLETAVYGQQLTKDTKIATKQFPMTWFDAFLIETRIGHFLQRWISPKFRSHKFEVEWDNKVLLPEWAHNLPKEMGRPVIHTDVSSRFYD